MTATRLTRFTLACTAALLTLGIVPQSPAQDTIAVPGAWPQWRGPQANQHAAENVKLPRKWDLATGEGIRWKSKLPGRGHSTPIVTPYGIYLTTADDDAGTQSVLHVETETGRLLNEWELHRGGLPREIHPNNSHASSSMAFDGRNLFASFYTNDAIYVTSLSPDGSQRWQKRVCTFTPSKYKFGFGASPIIEEDFVIIAAEYDGAESGIYALDRISGKTVWKIDRPANLNFASPIVATIAGRRQLLIGGAGQFASYDPTNGKRLWKVDTTTEAVCGTVAWDDRYVMVSGGFPQAGTWCVTADGREQLVWSNRIKCYEQSLLTIKNYVFGIADRGVAYCWRTRDGNEMWKQRLFGGGISASPLLADGHVVVATERGEVFVFVASPDRFEPIAKIQTGNSIFASPIAVENRLYIRTGVYESGGRQEYLVAIED